MDSTLNKKKNKQKQAGWDTNIFFIETKGKEEQIQ